MHLKSAWTGRRTAPPLWEVLRDKNYKSALWLQSWSTRWRVLKAKKLFSLNWLQVEDRVRRCRITRLRTTSDKWSLLRSVVRRYVLTTYFYEYYFCEIRFASLLPLILPLVKLFYSWNDGKSKVLLLWFNLFGSKIIQRRCNFVLISICISLCTKSVIGTGF